MTDEQVMALHRAGSRYHTRLTMEADALGELDRAIRQVSRCGDTEQIKPNLLEAVQRCKQARAEFFTLLNSISSTPTAEPQSTDG